MVRVLKKRTIFSATAIAVIVLAVIAGGGTWYMLQQINKERDVLADKRSTLQALTSGAFDPEVVLGDIREAREVLPGFNKRLIPKSETIIAVRAVEKEVEESGVRLVSFDLFGEEDMPATIKRSKSGGEESGPHWQTTYKPDLIAQALVSGSFPEVFKLVVGLETAGIQADVISFSIIDIVEGDLPADFDALPVPQAEEQEGEVAEPQPGTGQVQATIAIGIYTEALKSVEE